MDIFRVTKEEKEEARLRLQKGSQVRGSDKEYYDSLIDTFDLFRANRERVVKGLDLIKLKE